jgi:hypothetical protein
MGKFNSALDLNNMETNISTKTYLSIKHNKTHIFGSPFFIEVFSVNTKLLGIIFFYIFYFFIFLFF